MEAHPCEVSSLSLSLFSLSLSLTHSMITCASLNVRMKEYQSIHNVPSRVPQRADTEVINTILLQWISLFSSWTDNSDICFSKFPQNVLRNSTNQPLYKLVWLFIKSCRITATKNIVCLVLFFCCFLPPAWFMGCGCQSVGVSRPELPKTLCFVPDQTDRSSSAQCRCPGCKC